MPLELSHVHVQRIRRAVAAAKSGADVQFRVCQSEPKTIAWYEAATPRSQHVIANAYGDPAPVKAAIESAFLEMLLCGEKESDI